jgi:histone deacetylase HOS2
MQEIPPDLAGLRDEVEDRLREEKGEDEDVRKEKEEGLGEAMEL